MTAQTQSAMPLASGPLADEAGNPNTEWFRFFTDIWQKAGKSVSTVASAAFLQLNQTGTAVSALVSSSGQSLGQLFLVGKAGGAVAPIATPASPVNFAVPTGGSVVCDSNGTLQITRGGTTLAVAGGFVHALAGDVVIISWVGPAPVAAFLPDQ